MVGKMTGDGQKRRETKSQETKKAKCLEKSVQKGLKQVVKKISPSLVGEKIYLQSFTFPGQNTGSRILGWIGFGSISLDLYKALECFSHTILVFICQIVERQSLGSQVMSLPYEAHCMMGRVRGREAPRNHLLH